MWSTTKNFSPSSFWFAIYVHIAPLQCTKMGLQCRLGIYVGFDSLSIIRYLEPLTSNVFAAYFNNCHFDEIIFPPLRGEKSLPKAQREKTWNDLALCHLDPHTNQCEYEV